MLKALDAQNNPVAIKVFDYRTASDWKEVELFEREIEVLKDLDIKGVPKYIETIKTDDRIYLVEQYIHAQSLEKQIKNGREFRVDECVRILEQTSLILKELGKRHPPIVHRDIKPANLLIDDKLNVYLVDFGVVANTAQTFSMTFAGTAGYVAPEQLYGKTTPASDVFSLGATILHLISHVAPCDMKLKGISPDFDQYIPETVPEWLASLIKKMMSLDPEERPQNGDELYKQIQKIISSDETALNTSRMTIANTMISYDNQKEKVKKICWISLFLFVVLVFLLCNLIGPIGFGLSIYIYGAAFWAFDNYDRKKCDALVSALEPQVINNPKLKDLFVLALQGNCISQYDVANKYYSGTELKKNLQTAFEWFKLSAEQGYASAQNSLGIMYEDGEGVEQNYQEAMNWYRKSAEQGNPCAQYNLGQLYRKGQGVTENKEEAVKWYKLSAEQGYADAQYSLGFMYDKGKGVVWDSKEAVKWYQKAAEQGHVEAQYNLALKYDIGDGVEQDEHIAIMWYEKAAENGNADAQYNMALAYKKGQGVLQNVHESVKWFIKAAEQGHPDAQYMLAVIYDTGEGIEPNYLEARYWYEKAAEQEYAAAQFVLASKYYYAQGVDRNYQLAAKWYLKAAEQGHAAAQCYIGNMFEHGEGVGLNYSQAARWYKASAEQNFPRAQYYLGTCYMCGRGVKQDKVKAAEWYRKAASQGYSDAINMLNMMNTPNYDATQTTVKKNNYINNNIINEDDYSNDDMIFDNDDDDEIYDKDNVKISSSALYELAKSKAKDQLTAGISKFMDMISLNIYL